MRRWLPFLAYLVFVLVVIVAADFGKLGPVVKWFHSIPFFDKCAHATLIGTLAFLLNFALRGRETEFARQRWLLGSVIVAIAITLEECSQHWIPGRTFDAGDLLANWTGIFVAGWIGRKWLGCGKRQGAPAEQRSCD